MAARSLRDRLRSLFNVRSVGKINRNSTSLASFTAATDVLLVVCLYPEIAPSTRGLVRFLTRANKGPILARSGK